jgi:hypothetical protein
MSNGWIGVDLDGTLAHYDSWKGPAHIGPPVPKMLARVRKWLNEGKDVRIMTARVSPTNGLEAGIARDAIQIYTGCYFGKILPVTHEKDTKMLELWDDRVIQVIKNTGERVGSVPIC